MKIILTIGIIVISHFLLLTVEDMIEIKESDKPNKHKIINYVINIIVFAYWFYLIYKVACIALANEVSNLI